MLVARAVYREREAEARCGSSALSFHDADHAPEAVEKSFGEIPVDVWAFYRCFRNRWPEFIRRNFRNSTDAAAFFGVDDRTVRGWLEGSTAPRKPDWRSVLPFASCTGVQMTRAPLPHDYDGAPEIPAKPRLSVGVVLVAAFLIGGLAVWSQA